MTDSQFTISLPNSELTIDLDTGANQAHGSVIISSAGTSVLATATFSDDIIEETADYIPLRVDYLERFYAIQQILGPRYTRREGKPSDEAVLTARMIDRSIRPHLPTNLKNNLHIVVTVLSLGSVDPDTISVIAASLAIEQTGINWSGPVACTRKHINADNNHSSILVSGSVDLANMIEFSGAEVAEEMVSNAFIDAMKQNNDVLAQLAEINPDKETTKLIEAINDTTTLDNSSNEALEKLSKGTRDDSRTSKSLRDISVKLSPLSGAHGSARFSRGDTTVLSVVTLGTPRDNLFDESIESVKSHNQYHEFIHHYNFPPYASGHAGWISSPNRREIGHGHLAKNALKPLLPSKGDYSYSIRTVAEVLSSNGSSSMAAVCASSLALKSAGVPIENLCAGVAIGLAGSTDEPLLLTDITAAEDKTGLMDFKIAGTRKGITAMQLDTKNNGINLKIFNDSLQAGRDARIDILDSMKAVCDGKTFTHPENAPLIIEVPKEHIGRLIGKGGSNIRQIEDETGAKIAVENDRYAIIEGNSEAKKQVLAQIEAETRQYHVGEDFSATVREFLPYGAIVELDAGREALLHVSELRDSFVEKTEDLLKVGDKVPVTIVETSSDGRVKVSIREKYPKFFEAEAAVEN